VSARPPPRTGHGRGVGAVERLLAALGNDRRRVALHLARQASLLDRSVIALPNKPLIRLDEGRPWVVSHWLHSRSDAEQFEGAGLEGRRLGGEIEAVFPVAGQLTLLRRPASQAAHCLMERSGAEKCENQSSFSPNISAA